MPVHNSGDNFFKEIKAALHIRNSETILKFINRVSAYFGSSENSMHHRYEFMRYGRDRNPKKSEVEKLIDNIPALVFSQTPLNKGGNNEGFYIALGDFETTQQLAGLVDKLVATARHDDLRIIKDYLSKIETGNSVIDYLELKPNIMGLGVDLNKFFGVIGRFYGDKLNEANKKDQ